MFSFTPPSSSSWSSSSSTPAPSHSEAPPLWLIIVAQVLSTVGDAFGQRASRVVYKGSKRRLLGAMTIMNFVQLLPALLLAQLLLPTSITGTVYLNGSAVPCTDDKPCPSQGIIGLATQIIQHPLLLIAGCVNWLYYTGEIFLYKEPLGILFLVLASLGSSFLVPTVIWIFGLPTPQSVGWPVYVLGILGSVLCTIEGIELPHSIASRLPWAKQKQQRKDDPEAVGLINQATNTPPVKTTNVKEVALSTMRVVIPFAVLSFAYALWFCLQKVYNDEYRVNVFAFTAVDKVLLLFYVLPYLGLVGQLAPHIWS